MNACPSPRRSVLAGGAVLLAGLLLASCSKHFTPSETTLHGRWHAEKFHVSESLRLPVGPDLEFRPGTISALGERIPYESLQIKGNSVQVELGGMVPIGLVFRFESADEMHFELPLMLGDVVYRRVK
jgi:hypothetical protein